MNLDIIVTIIAGLGLFLVGIKLISSHLKQMAGRRFSTFMSKASDSRLKAGIGGVIAGFFIQSGRVTSFIVSGFVSGRILPLRRAMPIVFWSNVGCSILVVSAVLPTKLLILFILGFSGILFSFERPPHFKNIYGGIFGISLLLFGLGMMKSGASNILDYPWFQSLIDVMEGSYGLALFMSVILTLILQSHIGVIFISLAMVSSGLFDISMMLMIIYGAHVGSSLITYIFSANVKGKAKQVIAGQILFNIFGAGFFILLFFVEDIAGIPLVRALLELFIDSTDQQAAAATLIFNIFTALSLTLFTRPYCRFLNIHWPPSEEEHLSRLTYIHDQAVEEPETAFILAEKEQHRLLNWLPLYLEQLRSEPVQEKRIDVENYHNAFMSLSEKISEFLRNVLVRDLGTETSEQILNVQNRQAVLSIIEDNISEFYHVMRGKRERKGVGRLMLSILESLDLMLLTTLAVLQSGDSEEFHHLKVMTSDSGEVMENIRGKYLASGNDLSPEGRMEVLHITNLFDRTVSAFRQLSRLLEQNKDR